MSGGEMKDLAYYQANPQAIGELSEAQLDQLASQQGDTGQPESGQPPAAASAVHGQGGAPANPEPEPPAADTKATETPTTSGATDPAALPEGVATRDGQRIIPYEVLANERQRAKELERIAADQAKRLQELEAQAAGKKPDGGKVQEEAVTVLSEDELQDLEKELPAIGKLFRAQQSQLQTLGQTVQTLTQERQQREEEGVRTVQQTVQEAIDSNPKLAYLQSLEETNPAAWERAVRFDATLRQDPDWSNKSFGERFDKVVQLYEATYGEVKLPGQANTPAAPPPSQADLAKQAEEKLKGKQSVPTSLSAIPGGATPAADDVAGALTTKTGPELTADFMRMTPQQIEAALARLN